MSRGFPILPCLVLFGGGLKAMPDNDCHPSLRLASLRCLQLRLAARFGPAARRQRRGSRQRLCVGAGGLWGSPGVGAGAAWRESNVCSFSLVGSWITSLFFMPWMRKWNWQYNLQPIIVTTTNIKCFLLMLIPENSQTTKTLFELYKLVAQQTMVTSQLQLGTQILPVPWWMDVNGRLCFSSPFSWSLLYSIGSDWEFDIW